MEDGGLSTEVAGTECAVEQQSHTHASEHSRQDSTDSRNGVSNDQPDAHGHDHGQDHQQDDLALPPPPAPRNIDERRASQPASCDSPIEKEKSDEPLILEQEDWDIWSVSGLAALRMLIGAVEKLAESTGDVPPTPPVSRPTTPKKPQPFPSMTSASAEEGNEAMSPPPAPPTTSSPSPLPSLNIGSPEAHPTEPLTIDTSSPSAPCVNTQQAAIARRFFSKAAPPFSLSSYLLQMHTHCPHSAGVYLAAADYLHRLCVVDALVPATKRTVHRLCLAAIRVAEKVLEDGKWSQKRMALVGGVGLSQLLRLEVTLCYLLDFSVPSGEESMRKGILGLQRAAQRGFAFGGTAIHLRLPPRRMG